MKNRRFEIMIIVFMVIFALILFGISLIFNFIEERNSYTMIISPFSIFDCKKYECTNVSDKIEEYNNKEYNIFINNIDKGNNKLFYNVANNTFHIYDVFNNNIYNDINYSLFANSGNARIINIDYNMENMNENEILKVLSEANIDNNGEEVFGQKIVLDMDDDTKEESLYIVHNSGYDNRKEYFSIFAYENEGTISIIDKQINDSTFGLYINRITNIIDIFNDGKYEFINTKLNCDETEYCNVIYRVKGKKVEAINECDMKTIFN